MKQKIKQILSKRPRRKPKNPEATLDQAIRGIPRITNETVAEHREAVLGSARKFIYPLQHSAHRVVLISVALITVAIVSFFTYSLLALYKFQSTSTFIYRVTQVLPFPVAKAGPSFVSYESYLFELRHYMHYYQTQQKVDFKSDSGKRQLQDFSQQALAGVIDDAYVKQLAKQHSVTVTNQEVNDQVALIQAQNRLGDNPKVFNDVLKEFWGWSLSDFKRELKQQLLAQKVVSTLDTGTHQRADNVLAQIHQGGNFAQLAAQYSDDKTTSANGGDYGIAITRTNRDIPAVIVNQLFKMKPGEVSGIIDAGGSLEIVRLDSVNGDEVRASHIGFVFKSLEEYITPLEEKNPPKKFIAPK